MTLTEEERIERDCLRKRTTGAEDPRLDELNRKVTEDMTVEDLRKARCTRSDGAPQATAELRRRGYNV